jgi:amidophosphoribosyltransferase
MLYSFVDTNSDSLQHHCGVVGVFSKTESNIPEKLFYSLFSIQHRGQESAGIAYIKDGRTVVYKDIGMVSAVLSHYLTGMRPSKIGIGHVRYSTHGGNKIENVQPIFVSCNKGDIAIAHNGNLSNTVELKRTLVEEGSIFQSTSDTELILHLLSRSRHTDFRTALRETLLKTKGAYCLVLIHNNSLIAVRDPHGFRPLYIGKKHDQTIIASETCALDIAGFTDYRAVEAGEIIYIDDEGQRSEFLPKAVTKSQCVFELIYFARPDSKVFDLSVHLMRKKMGAALAEDDPVDGDIVVPVPDSGTNAALGYAEASGIPFELALTRNHYAGRSFIMPTTSARELAVRMKLHPVKEAIKGKKVILIDDSLVRGTTSKILVKLMREAGAKEIHLRLSSPEIKWPCFFGIDIPTIDELISNRMDPDGISSFIGADSVRFLSRQKLKDCLPDPEEFCFSCFSGNYPFTVPISELVESGSCCR